MRQFTAWPQIAPTCRTCARISAAVQSLPPDAAVRVAASATTSTYIPRARAGGESLRRCEAEPAAERAEHADTREAVRTQAVEKQHGGRFVTVGDKIHQRKSRRHAPHVRAASVDEPAAVAAECRHGGRGRGDRKSTR